MAILLFFVFLLTFATNSVTTTTDLQAFVHKTCSNNQTLQNHALQNQTTNLTFNTLFTALVSQSCTTKFFQTTITNITGLYQFRSDLSHDKCNICVQTLTNTIETYCYTARAQLLRCYIWYEVDVYHVDNPPVNGLWHEQCDVRAGTGTDFERYKNLALKELVDHVGNKNNSKTHDFHYPPIYAWGQCAGDLHVDDCENCLKTAFDFAQANCGSSFHGAVYLEKCYISYSVKFRFQVNY